MILNLQIKSSSNSHFGVGPVWDSGDGQLFKNARWQNNYNYI
jgi:hypothetical protein